MRSTRILCIKSTSRLQPSVEVVRKEQGRGQVAEGHERCRAWGRGVLFPSETFWHFYFKILCFGAFWTVNFNVSIASRAVARIDWRGSEIRGLRGGDAGQSSKGLSPKRGEWKCGTWKCGTIKITGVENARHENAAINYRGGKCEKSSYGTPARPSLILLLNTRKCTSNSTKNSWIYTEIRKATI